MTHFAAGLDALLPLSARCALLVLVGAGLMGAGITSARVAGSPPAGPLPTRSRPAHPLFDAWIAERRRAEARRLRLQGFTRRTRLLLREPRSPRLRCGPQADGLACCSDCAVRAAAARRSRSRRA